MISTFCGYTTAHGLGRLADGGGVFRRIAWSLFCIGALTMFVVQTYNLFAIYLRRPVSTVVTVQHDSVSIWHVYICFTFIHLKELNKLGKIFDDTWSPLQNSLFYVFVSTGWVSPKCLISKRDTQHRQHNGKTSTIYISFSGKIWKRWTY